jgi:hypothetical protein
LYSLEPHFYGEIIKTKSGEIVGKLLEWRILKLLGIIKKHSGPVFATAT